MSYLSISTFIETGEKCLEEKNYLGALAIALMLPSMCSRIEYKDNSDYKNKNGTYQDRKCYVDFCKSIIRVNPKSFLGKEKDPDGHFSEILGDKFSELLYQLRCDIVHAGEANICDDDKKLYLILDNKPSSTDFENYRFINVYELCSEIFNFIKCWYTNNMGKDVIYTFVLDLENSNTDKELYKSLTNKHRTETSVSL